MAPRVRFLQNAQKKRLENDPEKAGLSQEVEQSGAVHFTSSVDEAERRGALFSETITLEEEEIKELSSKESEAEGASQGQLQTEEESLAGKGSKAECMQLFEEDDDDTKDLDVLTVKRRNVFGLESKDSIALVRGFFFPF